MLAIKLKRIGKKHQPAYRLIVAERRSSLVGRYIEDLGWFNPLLNKSEFNKERIAHWLKVGAQPTDTVHNLFVNAGLVKGAKIAVHKKTKKPVEGAAKETATVAPVAPAPESAK